MMGTHLNCLGELFAMIPSMFDLEEKYRSVAPLGLFSSVVKVLKGRMQYPSCFCVFSQGVHVVIRPEYQRRVFTPGIREQGYFHGRSRDP